VSSGKVLLKVTHASSRDDVGDHLKWLDDVALSPQGQYLATGGRDGTARVWNLETGQELVRLKHGTPVGSVAFSADGSMLSTGGADGVIRVWELPSGKEKLRSVHSEFQYAVAEFSPDGSRLATAGADGAVHIWELARGDEEARIVHRAPVKLVAFAPDGSALATIDQKGGVRLWSPDGRVQADWDKSAFNPKRFMFSEDGRYLMIDAQNPSLIVLDARERLATKLQLGYRETDRKALGRRYLAAWDRASRLLRVWETAGLRELPAVELGGLGALALDSGGSFLATRQDHDRGESLLQVWALPDLRTPVLAMPVRQDADFWPSPRGRYLAVEVSERGADPRAPTRRYVDVWEVAARERVVRIPQDGDVHSVAYAPDDGVIYLRADDGVRAWELPAGKLKSRFGGEEDAGGVRVSGDGRFAATLNGRRVSAWDAATGQLLSQLLDAGYVRDARFSPDGRRLLTGGDDGAASVWLWRSDDLRDAACKRLPRNLTTDEWQRYVGERPYSMTCPNLPPGEQR
jgi:WD40 repeat protein